MSAQDAIAYERLISPKSHLGVLIEPGGPAAVEAALRAYRQPACDARLLDGCVAELRHTFRQRLGLCGPVILTGHQAEFFHAGVFAKTIAADAIAAQAGGSATFLTVDSDIPKTPSVAVPSIEGSPDRLAYSCSTAAPGCDSFSVARPEHEVHRTYAPIPGCSPQLSMEWQPMPPPAVWRDFFARLSGWSNEADADGAPLRVYEEAWFTGQATGAEVCDALVRGHAAVERSLGLSGSIDMRTSQLAVLPEFRAFVAHLVMHAPAFVEHYNAAQAAYRWRRQVRAPGRPAPPLQIDGERYELPFWIVRPGQPRYRLYVSHDGDRVTFFAEHERICDESAERLKHVDRHNDRWELECAGWQLRPRALMLSAFTRMFLADLFIHGIGGAKYDEMTEDFMRRMFGVPLAPMCCVSATMHLPLPTCGVGDREVRAARRRQRDVRFNPQRRLEGIDPDLLRKRAELIARSDALRHAPRDKARERREIYEGIQAVNDALCENSADQVAEIDAAVRRLEQQRRSDEIATDREFFFAMHSRAALESLVERIRAALADGTRVGDSNADERKAHAATAAHQRCHSERSEEPGRESAPD